MKKLLIISIFLVFTAGVIFAQGKVIVRLKQPPPNKLGAADLWKLDITNTTKEDINIYLTGTAAEEKDGLIVDGQSKVFTVRPGKKTYGYQDFKSGEVNWKNETYEEAIIRTGNVKSGNYNICVTAFYENGQAADNEQCITQIIEITSEGMITLISPGDGEEINPESGVMFVWTGTGLKGPYTLKIVEIAVKEEGLKRMKENRAFFEKEGISTTTFQYPLSAPKFENGKMYAWMVKAGNVESEVLPFLVINGQIINLNLTPISCQGCCFTMSITGNFSYSINAFKLTSVYDPIISVNLSSGLSIVNQTSSEVVIKQNNSAFISGSTIGTICFTQSNNPFPISILWSTNGGAAFMGQADQTTLQCAPPCPDTCSCIGWGPVNVSFNKTTQSINCGATINVPNNTQINFNSSILCSDSSCTTPFSATIIGPNGNYIAPVYGSGINAGFTSLIAGNYTIQLNGSCGIVPNFSNCPPCIIYIHVDSSIINDTCQGTITAPQTVYYTLGTYPVFPNIMLNNFPGTSYNWQLISDPFNPSQCPGATGTMNGTGPFSVTLNQYLTSTCKYNFIVTQGSCTTQVPITFVPSVDSCQSCGLWDQVTVQQGTINVSLPVVNKQVWFTQTFGTNQPITIIPTFSCLPNNCSPSYQWRAWTFSGPGPYQNGPIIYTFNAPSWNNAFTIKPLCGNNPCDTIWVRTIIQ